MLFDVAIRDATDNRKSLDDVTRALYTRFYQRRKGFRTADLLGLLREAGMPDVAGFYRRYINGREPLPYESVFPKAGIAVARQTQSSPFLGLNAQPGDSGKLVVQGVVPGSAAEAAGHSTRGRDWIGSAEPPRSRPWETRSRTAAAPAR